MPKYWTLRYSDGDFTIVTSPPLLSCNPTTLLSGKIRAYHLELLRQLQGQTSWVEDVEGLRSIDAQFYAQFRLYYCKVGALLEPQIDPDRLTWRDRHTFFVCTDPIVHPESEVLVPGLSGLEQIMGYRYSKTSDALPPQTTTGDPELDILTDALLVFKRKGFELAQLLPLEDLAKVLRQASDRLKPAADEEGDLPETPEPPEDERFLAVKGAIEQELRAIGVAMPEGF